MMGDRRGIKSGQKSGRLPGRGDIGAESLRMRKSDPFDKDIKGATSHSDILGKDRDLMYLATIHCNPSIK